MSSLQGALIGTDAVELIEADKVRHRFQLVYDTPSGSGALMVDRAHRIILCTVTPATPSGKQEHDVITAGDPISAVLGALAKVTELHGRRQFGFLLGRTFAAGQSQFSAP